jgi:hypothetical protein
VQQASQEARACTPTNGRLSIPDKTSKRKFLIDTGSDLCVFPRKLIPQRKSRVNYELRAVNGTTIPTYGWLPLSLNLGLRRDFTWRFVVADVTQPIIGADFLSHFGLLVDLKKKRLLDGTTSLSAPTQTASSQIPSVKLISGNISIDTLLSESSGHRNAVSRLRPQVARPSQRRQPTSTTSRPLPPQRTP